MPAPTAHLDKVITEGEATGPGLTWYRQFYTRLADQSKDQFLSEIDDTWDGADILTALEADTGETYE